MELLLASSRIPKNPWQDQEQLACQREDADFLIVFQSTKDCRKAVGLPTSRNARPDMLEKLHAVRPLWLKYRANVDLDQCARPTA
ncbi:hypothetical protein V5F49_16250 [Xanthobacter sp. V3C-3]|uniref:hypothetical protein n=1 Tax=Xanthobacter lutulentifluminis TaxID=3119935 RepID=UPI00372CD661